MCSEDNFSQTLKTVNMFPRRENAEKRYDIFPITSDINLIATRNIETVVLLSKETCRRPDTYVKIGVDVEEYINIKNNGKM